MCQIFLSRHNNIFAAVSPQTAGEITITPQCPHKNGRCRKRYFSSAGRRLVLSGYLRLNLVASHWQTRSWTLSRARIRRKIYFPEKNDLFVFASTEATLTVGFWIWKRQSLIQCLLVFVRQFAASQRLTPVGNPYTLRGVTLTRLLLASTKLSNMSCTWKYCFMCIWTLNLIWELRI